jgi:peptide/nickel transport system substrate-binding protein
MRKLTRRELVTGAIPAGLASCSRSNTRHPQDRSTVTVLYGDSDALLTPDLDAPAKFLVFVPLVTWNRRGELEGRLAESWVHSPDFRTWTIRLREGVRWHDGAQVTAYDVKFTLDLLQHPDTLLAPSNYAVNVVDDRTCTIAYDRQDLFDEGAITDYFSCWPRHLLERLDPKQINAWDFWKRPVGCGPYRHVRTVPGTMMEFEANPDYFRGKPKITRVILRFGRGSAVPELLSGNVDAVCGPPRADVSNVSRKQRFRVYQNHYGAGLAVYWNLRNPLFQDSAVRRALTYAINRRELLKVLNLPADASPVDFVRTDRQGRIGDFREHNPYNPELAARILDQVGYVRHGKEVRRRNGKPCRFKTLVATALAESLPSAVYVQDQLKRIGVHMDIVTISDIGLVLSRIKNGEFEAAIAGQGADALESNLRHIGYNNSSFFAVLDRTHAAFDPEEKDRFHGELTEIFQADVPQTFLHPFAYTTIANTRVRGLGDSPYRGDMTWCMDELWLEEQA